MDGEGVDGDDETEPDGVDVVDEGDFEIRLSTVMKLDTVLLFSLRERLLLLMRPSEVHGGFEEFNEELLWWAMGGTEGQP